MIQVGCFVDGKQKFLFKCKDAPQARMEARRFIEEQEPELVHRISYFMDAMTALRLALDGEDEVKHGVSNGHSAVCFEKKADEKPKGPARPFVVTAENWPEDMEDDLGCIPAVFEPKGDMNAKMNWCFIGKGALHTQSGRYWCGGFPTTDDRSAAPWPEDKKGPEKKAPMFVMWEGYFRALQKMSADIGVLSPDFTHVRKEDWHNIAGAINEVMVILYALKDAGMLVLDDLPF